MVPLLANMETLTTSILVVIVYRMIVIVNVVVCYVVVVVVVVVFVVVCDGHMICTNFNTNFTYIEIQIPF